MLVQVNHQGAIVAIGAMQPREGCQVFDFDLAPCQLAVIYSYKVVNGELVVDGEAINCKQRAERQVIARAYLCSTDFYLIRQGESGKPIPPEVLTNRAKAREILDSAKIEFEL